jgi:hypothetical protein
MDTSTLDQSKLGLNEEAVALFTKLLSDQQLLAVAEGASVHVGQNIANIINNMAPVVCALGAMYGDIRGSAIKQLTEAYHLGQEDAIEATESLTVALMDALAQAIIQAVHKS